MKIYRQVEVNDNHVGVFDVYLTKDGVRVFGVVYLEQSTLLWKVTANDGSYCYVTHAIEEIELPSDDDINDFKVLKDKPNKTDLNRLYAFKQGAFFILNKLKNG